MKVSILGDGGWGTALSLVLQRKGTSVTLWSAFPDYAAELSRSRVNRKFLPGVELPEEVRVTGDISAALREAGAVILAVPSQFIREICEKARPFLPQKAFIISAAKGLEIGTLKRMTEVIDEVVGIADLAAISGPSHAEEVARSIPTSVVVASLQPAVARSGQELLMEKNFRVYTNDDVVGVEIGGAIKNVIAIAAGICDGLGLGDNAKAALLTRGMVEIARLGTIMGGRLETFWGLSGIGDLIVTSYSRYGRNLRLGRMIGQGMSLKEALATSEMVVEGVKTAQAVPFLAQRYGIEMPIAREVYNILYENKPPLRAVRDLMTRGPKAEVPR